MNNIDLIKQCINASKRLYKIACDIKENQNFYKKMTFLSYLTFIKRCDNKSLIEYTLKRSILLYLNILTKYSMSDFETNVNNIISQIDNINNTTTLLQLFNLSIEEKIDIIYRFNKKGIKYFSDALFNPFYRYESKLSSISDKHLYFKVRNEHQDMVLSLFHNYNN